MRNFIEAKNTGRLFYLDNVRGFASIMGVFFHVGLMINNNNAEGIQLIDFSSYVTYFNSVRMPMFLFIAGYFTYYSLSKYSTGEYLVKRLERIGIPFFFGILIILPLDYYLELLFRFKLNDIPYRWYYFDFFANFKFDHLWFLYRILLFSFMAVILFLLLKKLTRVKGIIDRIFKIAFSSIFISLPFFILVIFLARKTGYFIESFLFTENIRMNEEFLPIHVSFSQFTTFLLGAFALRFKYQFEKKIISGKRIETGFLFAVYIAAILIDFKFNFPGDGIIQQVIVVSLLLLMLNLLKAFLNFSNQFLNYIATASYPFYILHYPVSMLVVYLYIKYSITTNNVLVDYFSLCIVTTLLTYSIYSSVINSNIAGRLMITGLFPKEMKKRREQAINLSIKKNSSSFDRASK